MHVPLAAQLAHYRSHPPSALGALTATPIELDFRWDGHGGPVNAIFLLSCPCSSTLFDVYCYVDEGEVRSPIEVLCDGCEEPYCIYDANKHGHDGVTGLTVELGPEAYDTDLACEWSPHEVIVRFEFPSNRLGDPDHAGREHDLFSWITVVARDPSSGETTFLFDDECA